MMPVKVLLFASYAEALGASHIDVDVPVGATVRDVLAQVLARSGGQQLPPSPLIAVNETYAPADHRLSPHDEVAIIPPVAGG